MNIDIDEDDSEGDRGIIISPLIMDVERLHQLLKPAGYWLVQNNTRVNHVSYSRHSSVPGCFEQIKLHARVDGMHLWIEARVSVIPGIAQWRNSFERQLCLPVLEQNGEVFLKTATSAREWEDRVAEIVPEYAREFTSNAAPECLARTEKARTAADLFVPSFPVLNDAQLEEYLYCLKGRCTAHEIETAGIFGQRALITIAGDEVTEQRASIAYQITSLEIARKLSDEADHRFFAMNANPRMDVDFACCIQIVASRIFGDRGW